MEWLERIFGKMNRKGIPAPVIRDPKTGVGSITATLVVVSSGLCSVCVILAILSALAKAGGVFSSFTEAQQAIQNAFGLSFQFFMASSGLYIGRKMQRDPKGQINIDGKDDQPEDK